MAGERGQRTTIRFGGVRMAVSLVKTSAPRKEAHETRRVVVAAEHIEAHETVAADEHGRAISSASVPPFVAGGQSEPSSGLGTDTSPMWPAAVGAFDDCSPAVSEAMARRLDAERAQAPSAPVVEADPLDDAAPHIPGAKPTAEHHDEVAQMVPAPRKVEQGVYRPSGEWVDLTDTLAQLDRLTKLDGMEVVATVSSSAVLRERVRESHYVCGVEPGEYKRLALLWHGLRQTSRAAVVVWTKRTARALGIIVARGTLGEDAHLILLELEWADNMRDPLPRALGPIGAEVSGDEVAAVVELVEAYEAGPSALNGIRDQRAAKREELLSLAREGRLQEFRLPDEPLPDVEDLSDLAAAFHATASVLR